MRHGHRIVRKQNNRKISIKKPILEISPINRNFSNDDLVIEEISVNSNHSENKHKKNKLPKKVKKDDWIIIGIIILLFLNRHNDEDDAFEENNQSSSGNGIFSLEKIKKMIPIDKLSDNDILMILMVYLLL